MLKDMLQELMDKFKVGGVPQINPTAMDMSLAHRQNRQMLAAGGIISKVASKILRELGEGGKDLSKEARKRRKDLNKELFELRNKDVSPEEVDELQRIKMKIEYIDDELGDVGGDTMTAQELSLLSDEDLENFGRYENLPWDEIDYYQEMMQDRKFLMQELKDISKGKKGRSPIEMDEEIPFAEGGNVDAQMADMMPDDQMIAEAQAEDFAQEGMVPDEEMEEDYVEFIMSEALEPEEQQYLSEKLVEDDQLSMIFDKVVETASEFSGSGPVEGPGTGISDSIPARLSDGEFVMTAKATDAIGVDTLDELMALAEQEADSGRQMKQTGGSIKAEPELIPSVIVEEEDPIKQKNIEVMRALDPRLSLFAS
jgi:hypothetical protein|tara:strand:- start:36 stop:1142 length:1107 start_codon:yes stop_codon:yes gene_type:complete